MTDAERELVSEPELRELFRQRRPEPEAFRQGVERRIREKRRQAEEQAEKDRRSPLRAMFRQQVASLFPAELLAGGLAGSAAAKLAGVKLLPAALALPAILLASVAGAFAAGARSLLRTLRGARPGLESPERHFNEPPSPRNRDLALGGRLFRWIQAGCVISFLSPMVFGMRALDLVLFVLVLSVVSLALTVRGLARAGLVTTTEVARLCAGVLGGFFAWLFPFYAMHFPTPGSGLELPFSVVVVVLGLAVCRFSLNQGAPAWGRALRVLGVAAAAVLVIPLGTTGSSTAALQHMLVSFHSDVSNLNGWREVAAASEVLRGTGADVPGLERIAASVRSAIDDGAGAANAPVWSAASRMGRIDAEHWKKLAENTREDIVDKLLSRDGKLPHSQEDEYVISMVLAAGELSSEERNQLIARVQATWPGPSDYDPLEDAVLCVRWLDLLGRPDLVDGRRAEVHELLRRQWVSGRNSWPGLDPIGGFDSDPEEACYSSEEPTWYGIELMARCGVPAGIDLRLLQGYLRSEARATLLGLIPDRHPLNGLSLARLEREIGIPRPTWLERLIGQRIFIASSLIVGLCVVAIRLTPSSSRISDVALPSL